MYSCQVVRVLRGLTSTPEKGEDERQSCQELDGTGVEHGRTTAAQEVLFVNFKRSDCQTILVILQLGVFGVFLFF